MQVALVTLRFKKNPEHNPHDKQSGMCVANMFCTDKTGEHHTIAFKVDGVTREIALERIARELSHAHITRVEFTDVLLTPLMS